MPGTAVQRPPGPGARRVATCCTVRSAPARAVASTSPTTSDCVGGSRSRCCTRRSPTTPRSCGGSAPRPSSRRRCVTQHRHGLRLGRGRRAVHGARAPRGRQPPVDARPGNAAHGCAGRARRTRRRVGARVRARPRRAAPRREAGEPACSTSTASCASPTSVSPARSPKRAGPNPRAACSAPRATRRRSRRRVCSSTRAPTSTRSRWCSSSR